MLFEESKVRNKMKEVAKENRVRVSYGGFYAKRGDYFWTVQNVPHSYNSRNVISGIKLWSWDETLDSIVHPDNRSHFTDLSRWTGGAAMSTRRFTR